MQDAVIVGAGPAGSAAAIVLARAGWSVVLVEKEVFPRRKVCGECVAASNLPLFDILGVGPQFAAAAGPALRRVALMRGERTVDAPLPPLGLSDQLWGHALGRETLDVLLLHQARAEGVEILQPWSVQSIDGEAGAWRCRIRAEQTDEESVVRARVAIDAHGSWQALPAVRQSERRTPRAADFLAFKANYIDADLADGMLPVLAFDGGYGGMVVADDGMTTVACCVRRDRLEQWRRAEPGQRAGEVVDRQLRLQCRGVREALQRATRVGPWLAAGPLNPGIHVDAGDGPFRIGNAAGEAHPIIGEGMSMALQSAWLLTRHLLDQRNASRSRSKKQREIARGYEAQWWRLFAPRLVFAAGFAHLAMRPQTAVPLVGLAAAWPGMLTLGARIKSPLHHKDVS